MKKRSSERKIAVYGVGKNAYVAEAILQDIGVVDYIFLDNDENKIGKIHHGKMIYSGTLLESAKREEYFILISTGCHYEISKQLEKLGYQNLRDYMNVLNTALYDDLLECCDFVNKGMLRAFGNDEYSFKVYEEKLSQKKTIRMYSFGIGEDLSFSNAMAKAYPQMEIYAFDPTPKSIKYVEEYDKSEFNTFIFRDVGLSDDNSIKTFFLPKCKEYVSGSETKYSEVGDSIEVQMCTLETIMNDLQHDYIDVLKMDIEGSEFVAVPQFMKEVRNIEQICIEIHDRFYEDGREKRRELFKCLKNNSYQLVAISNTGEEFTYIKI